jgi:hypothetical protein
MKTRMILLVLVAMTPLIAWAQGKYVPKDNEELYGTWTNEKYVTIWKIIVFPGGYKEYYKGSDSDPYRVITLELASKWNDSDGNVWYKAFGSIVGGRDEGIKFQEIYKISESGTKWELTFFVVREFDPERYPTEIIPGTGNYGCYYRANK